MIRLQTEIIYLIFLELNCDISILWNRDRAVAQLCKNNDLLQNNKRNMNKQFNYQLPDIYLYCNPLSNVSRIDAYLCSCILLVTHTYKRRR